MTIPAPTPATYDDLCAVPDNLVAEILHGRLVTHPRPAPKHALTSSGLGGKLMQPFHYGIGGPGGWWIIDEPELHLGPHVVVPDLAGWRRERMVELPETAWFETVPDWICEVVSPSSGRYDRVTKRTIYAAFEVGFYWLAVPAERTLETFVLRNGEWLLAGAFGDNDQANAPPFAAAPFALGALWPN
ncbi:MAG: Uma2 family endonuclease [Hyphomicrobiaceae bacterium]